MVSYKFERLVDIYGQEYDQLYWEGDKEVIRITIPGIPPTLNELKRMHYLEWARQKMLWGKTVGWEVKRQKVRPPEPFLKAIVTLNYYFKSRRRTDPDNNTGKFLLDGLVESGILVDDSFDHIELNIRKGGVDKHNPRVEIMIERLEEEGE
jgi:crossover junction endodeoxyribonuclease RusA